MGRQFLIHNNNNNNGGSLSKTAKAGGAMRGMWRRRKLCICRRWSPIQASTTARGRPPSLQSSQLSEEVLLLFWHTAKRGGLGLSMEGLEGVEEQRRRGKKGLKLLLSKVKVLLLSLSRTIIVCGFRFYDQCLMRARWSGKYSQCPNKPNSES